MPHASRSRLEQAIRRMLSAPGRRIACPVSLAMMLAAMGHAAVVDRVALVVGKAVFTQSEVDDEARLAELEAGKPLDVSAAQRKQAAERLVDQELLREEMNVTEFQAPATDKAALLSNFRQKHFPSVAQYRAALTHYGVTEEALEQRLLWELTLLRFTDQRFAPLAAVPDQNSANRSTNGAPQPAGDTVDQEMESWLKQQRAETRIVFKPEAFK